MRGRKRIPTVLKLIRGNPGHRPISPDEPQHAPLAFEAPDGLSAGARLEWQRIAPQLIERGQVTDVDRGVLIAYCEKWAQWRALEEEATQHPTVVKAGRSGFPMPNPIIGLANKALALMLKAAAELGITPSARARVSVRGKDQTPLEAFIRGAKRRA